MGFLIVGTGGGGSSAPDGTLPTYTTMSALDAGLTTVGRMAQLVGATTGAVILTCRRVAAGAGGLEILGPILLWQADGTEFDGAFAWASLGTAGAVTWGAAGDEATGGLIPPIGTVMLSGFRRLHGIRQRAMVAQWYVEAVPASPGTGMCLAVGVTPADEDPLRLIGYGIGYSATNYRNIVHAGATSYDAPSATAGGINLAPPALPYLVTVSGLAHPIASSSVQVQSGAIFGADVATGGGGASASASNGLPAAANLAPTVTRVGIWTARLISLSWPPEGT